MLASENPVFKKAVKYVSADEQLRYELYMKEKTELDYYSAMKTSYDKGRAEGLAERMQEAARILLKSGESPEKISKLLGIAIDEINNLE